MKTETKVYDLEAEDLSIGRPNPTMAIDRHADTEVDGMIRRLDDLIAAAPEFSEKRKLLSTAVRKANDPIASKAVVKFMYYALLREIQESDNRLDKSYCLAMIRDNIARLKMDGEFKLAYVQSLLLLFELEKCPDIAVMQLEIIAQLSRECYFDSDSRYEMISIMHARLYHNDSKIKKNALSIIISLTKHTESDFLVVFENMLERCAETQNRDLILIFLQTLADLDFVVFSAKISKMVIDIVVNPIFSDTRDCLISLLHFLHRVVLSFSSIGGDLAKCVFVFLCRHMRSLHRDVRKLSIEVFCQMDLRQVGDELLVTSIQKEKFEDYQSRKKGQHNMGNAQSKKSRAVENFTEKTVNQMEIKSNSDNVVIGCIHHVLEDELPEIRIAAIKALETLGKILTVEKTQDIKELLLYFLNDDFDRVRIKSLQSLHALFNEISLSDFELDTIHFNLKENLYELRIAIYKLLGNFTPKKSSQVVKIIQKLLDNIKLYREDAPWIYKTIKKIFDKNKKYHLEVLKDILFIDSANLIQEKDFKDPESIVRVILLSNALKQNPALIDRYPHYFKKHVILLKEIYPALIYDIDNDMNSISAMKSSVLGDDTIRSFIKCLNEQVRNRENHRLHRLIKQSTDGSQMIGLQSMTMDMFSFCDKLIRSIRLLKLEINSILPDKRRIVETLLKIIHIRQSLRISSNLKKYFNLCEAFFWVEYLYCKIRSGQIKRKINSVKISTIVSSLYESASYLAKDDSTGMFAKLSQILQPMTNSMTHAMMLTSGSLLAILQAFITDFNIQEFAFYSDDFLQILTEKAMIHSREVEGDVIEVVPRYPFNFKIYIEADAQVNLNNSRHLHRHTS